MDDEKTAKKEKEQFEANIGPNEVFLESVPSTVITLTYLLLFFVFEIGGT